VLPRAFRTSAVGLALQGLTTRGRCFLAAGGASAASAVVIGERDLLRVAGLLAALPVVAALVVARTRYRLACTRSLSPHRVEAGRGADVVLRLDNVSRLPTSVLLMEDAVPYQLGARPRFVLDRVEAGGVRSVTYPVRPEVRGRYRLGPLSVRLTDPFGFCELTRSFTSADTLVVTPVVERLPGVRLGGDWTGGGESRTRSVAASGEDDVATRSYRQGDDLRRVHWRSTARTGELMVRREEQPWSNRATLLLDTRAVAHRGDGPASTFEWSVSAAASVAVHLARSRYALRLVTDVGREVVAATPALAETLLLDELAVVGPSRTDSLGTAISRLAGSGRAGLLVAVLGQLSVEELPRLAGLRSGTAACVAVLPDVGDWAGLGGRGRAESDAALARAADLLTVAGWRVLVARAGQPLADLWPRAGLDRSPALAAAP
jgi:uncharacterized protein (DUF58 family)